MWPELKLGLFAALNIIGHDKYLITKFNEKLRLTVFLLMNRKESSSLAMISQRHSVCHNLTTRWHQKPDFYCSEFSLLRETLVCLWQHGENEQSFFMSLTDSSPTHLMEMQVFHLQKSGRISELMLCTQTQLPQCDSTREENVRNMLSIGPLKVHLTSTDPVQNLTKVDDDNSFLSPDYPSVFMKEFKALPCSWFSALRHSQTKPTLCCVWL